MPQTLVVTEKKPSRVDPTDAKTQAAFDRGIQWGNLAQQLFLGGINAQGLEKWHNINTVKCTAELIAKGTPIIYEAAFLFQDVLCAIDILVKQNNTYQAYEVKSSYELKPQHLQDGALQYFVLNGAGIELTNFNIMHLSSPDKHMGPLLLKDAFICEDIIEYAQTQQPIILEDIRKMKRLLSLNKEPAIPMGDHCNKPYPCNFKGYCSSILF
jgi:hypothetical protein